MLNGWKPRYEQEYILCYIEGSFAYFTNKPLNEQWGDDWDDIPFEHNAGDPYYDSDDQIVKIAFDGYGIESVLEHAGYNSRYSVKMINSGAVAWLTGYHYREKTHVSILAGSTIKDFVRDIQYLGGKVYLPL